MLHALVRGLIVGLLVITLGAEGLQSQSCAGRPNASSIAMGVDWADGGDRVSLQADVLWRRLYGSVGIGSSRSFSQYAFTTPPDEPALVEFRSKMRGAHLGVGMLLRDAALSVCLGATSDWAHPSETTRLTYSLDQVGNIIGMTVKSNWARPDVDRWSTRMELAVGYDVLPGAAIAAGPFVQWSTLAGSALSSGYGRTEVGLDVSAGVAVYHHLMLRAGYAWMILDREDAVSGLPEKWEVSAAVFLPLDRRDG